MFWPTKNKTDKQLAISQHYNMQYIQINQLFLNVERFSCVGLL